MDTKRQRRSMDAVPDRDKLTVIGAGRLGLCWALCAEKAGFAIKAVDIFPSYIDAINKKTLVSHEPSLMEMLKESKNLEATLSVAEGVGFCDNIFIFVQTPSSGNDQHYDHTHLNDVLCQMNTLKVSNKHIVICCTVMPGYCDMVAPSLLSDCTNVTVSYSPEFIAQGAIIQVVMQCPLHAPHEPLTSAEARLRGRISTAAALVIPCHCCRSPQVRPLPLRRPLSGHAESRHGFDRGGLCGGRRYD